MPPLSRFPYDRSWDAILRQGGPIFWLVLLSSTLVLLVLISRRFLFTNPRVAAFSAIDPFLLVASVSLPLLYSLAAIPTAYLALQQGGIDADWSLPMALQEVSLLAQGTLAGLLLLLICGALQGVIRAWREARLPRDG